MTIDFEIVFHKVTKDTFSNTTIIGHYYHQEVFLNTKPPKS